MDYQRYQWVMGPLGFPILEPSHIHNDILGRIDRRDEVSSNPPPSPWTVERSVAFLVSAASSKVAAANMTNKNAAPGIIAAADGAIAAFIDSDDICPRWPFPGPPPWLAIIASDLTLYANTLQAGSLQTAILKIAGQVLDRVALNPQPLPP
jgi:hypothetical protein